MISTIGASLVADECCFSPQTVNEGYAWLAALQEEPQTCTLSHGQQGATHQKSMGSDLDECLHSVHFANYDPHSIKKGGKSSVWLICCDRELLLQFLGLIATACLSCHQDDDGINGSARGFTE